MEFPLRITPLLRPLLFPLRVTSERALARVGGGHVEIDFGVLFHGKIPLEQIEHIGHATWPWWGGVGLRIATRGRIGLIGSREGIVCIHFTRPLRVHAPLPWRCHELFLSLHDPKGFIATVEAAAHMAAA